MYSLLLFSRARDRGVFCGKRERRSQIDLTHARLNIPKRNLARTRGREEEKEKKRIDASRAKVSYLHGNHLPAWRHVSERSESQHYKYKRFERRARDDALKTTRLKRDRKRKIDWEREGDIRPTSLWTGMIASLFRHGGHVVSPRDDCRGYARIAPYLNHRLLFALANSGGDANFRKSNAWTNRSRYRRGIFASSFFRLYLDF